METTGFSETSVNIYQMTNQRIPEAEYPNIPLGEYLRTQETLIMNETRMRTEGVLTYFDLVFQH